MEVSSDTTETFIYSSQAMEDLPGPNSSRNNDVSENVRFSDATIAPSMRDMSGDDSTRHIHTNESNMSLSDFFKRPVVSNFTLPVGSSYHNEFNPWIIFFENHRVINRINNYNLLSCSLKVSFRINGNPFLYGRYLVSYHPFAGEDDMTQNRALVPEDAVQMSQMPHIFLDPTLSAGGDLLIPFFYDKNKLNVVNSEWDRMGTITIRSLNDLKHANGSTDPITVTVFISAVDVKLDSLTSVDSSTIVPQVGNGDANCNIPLYSAQGEIDEANGKGFISKPASTIASIAGKLSSVPVLRPYALATEMAMGTIGGIAKLFGYSAPTLTKCVEPFRPVSSNDISTCNTPKFARKLTIDDKQELSIDPRISGLAPDDSLALDTIANKESYWTKFSWPMSAASESILWNCKVSPMVWSEDTQVPVGFHLPACAFAALPFEYWSGTMVYRFQIVSSSMHRGRLKIVYDPNFNSGDYNDEFNVNEIKVVDISQERDFSFEIGVGRETTFLKKHRPGLDSVTELSSSTRYSAVDPFGNGVLGVYVVNELTSPNSVVNNDIEINVYVSLKDAQFAAPTDEFQNFVFAPQTGDDVEMADLIPLYSSQVEVCEQMASEHPSGSNDVLACDTNIDDDLYKVFFGERILSFRTLLKRFNFHTLLFAVSNAQTQIHYGRRNMFPYYRGGVTGAVDMTEANQTVSSVPYNFCNTTLLNYVVAAYSGWRGSIRYQLDLFSDAGNNKAYLVTVGRVPEQSTGTYSRGESNWGGALTYAKLCQREISTSGTEPNIEAILPLSTGGLIDNGFVNTSTVFEVPYYSSKRFVAGKHQDYTTSTNTSPYYDYRIACDLNGNARVLSSVSSGEDFQVFFFTGLPPIYFEASPPPAL